MEEFKILEYAHLYIEKYDGKNLLVDFAQEGEFIYFRNNGDYTPSMRLREYEPTQLLFRSISGLNLKDGDVILFPMEVLRKIRREETQNKNQIQVYATILFEIENGAEYFSIFQECPKVKYTQKKELEYYIKSKWEGDKPCSLEKINKITELYVLDVGQGSTNFIFGEDDYLTIFDFGTSMYASNKQIEIIIGDYYPWLRAYKTSLIISHWDVDHYNIISKLDDVILESMRCVFAPEKAISLTAKQVAKKLEKSCPRIVSCSSPKRKIRNRVGLQIVSENRNYQLFIGERSSDGNKSGLALTVYGENGIAMLTADHSNSQVWTDMYEQIKSRKENKELHIVVPHHGADCGRFNKKACIKNAGVATVSVGKNSYKHPNQKTLDYYENVGFEIKRTDWERTLIEIKL